MDQKAVYEITVTEKLEQLTVPDLADTIWARIETQLDIDMPTDDGPSEPPTKPSWGNGFGLGLVFIAALISIIYFVNVKPNAAKNDSTVSPETPTIISAPANENDKRPPSPNIIIPSSPIIRQNDSVNLPPDNAVTTVIDSAVGTGQTITDSVKGEPVVLTPTIVNPTAVDTKAKKNRGVKGIQDADYRVVPAKKDTE